MSSGETTTDPEPDQAESARAERRVEDRAEEIVERVSADMGRFLRRTVARAREEVEDILAEAQRVRRGDFRRE